MFMSSLKHKFTLLQQNSVKDVSLVSIRQVGAHPDGHQHGVSIQISINLDKTFLRISRIRKMPLTWNLARVFVYSPHFISQILDFIYGTVLSFILIYFEWRDNENQQLKLENIGPTFTSFNPCPPLSFVVTDDRKQFQ